MRAATQFIKYQYDIWHSLLLHSMRAHNHQLQQGMFFLHPAKYVLKRNESVENVNGRNSVGLSMKYFEKS